MLHYYTKYGKFRDLLTPDVGTLLSNLNFSIFFFRSKYFSVAVKKGFLKLCGLFSINDLFYGDLDNRDLYGKSL